VVWIEVEMWEMGVDFDPTPLLTESMLPHYWLKSRKDWLKSRKEFVGW
jgi:hypothetical protein